MSMNKITPVGFKKKKKNHLLTRAYGGFDWALRKYSGPFQSWDLIDPNWAA